jgi:hypothetical protein
MAAKRRAKRTKKEMVSLDKRIRPLYERGLGSRRIAGALNENPATVFKRIRRMGILRTGDAATAINVVEQSLPFSRHATDNHLRTAAIGDAVRWFSSRGYTPSVPVDVARYDLVVESDAGLKRIQVKTTMSKARRNGRWFVRTCRHAYDKNASIANAAGKRRDVAYTTADADYFYILTSDGSRYIVPVSVTGGTLTLTLDIKYAQYKVR